MTAVGNHVGVQEQAPVCSLRGLVPRLSGTAVYGPVRTGTRLAILGLDDATFGTIVAHFACAVWEMHLTNDRSTVASGANTFGMVWKSPFVLLFNNL